MFKSSFLYIFSCQYWYKMILEMKPKALTNANRLVWFFHTGLIETPNDVNEYVATE